VALLSTGYQLLSESRYDQLEPALEILREDLAGLGLPLRSFECEFGPSQAEVTLDTLEGLAAADAVILFRSATKQILRRHGYHATFMCRPKLPNVMSSGWHLHQSLSRSPARKMPLRRRQEQPLSATGMHYLAGLLAHAKGLCALAAPTINGYKRYRPYSLAPDRIHWGRDNRGVMLRVIGSPGAARRTHRKPHRRAGCESRTSTSRRRSTRASTASRRKLDPGLPPTRRMKRRRKDCRRRSAEALQACAPTNASARARRFVRRLFLPYQGSRDRALQSRSERVGTARVFRPVLTLSSAG
jgi:hypothetical protein